MLWKFPQMFFAKLDNNRNLISIICEPYLSKTIFTFVHIIHLKLSDRPRRLC
jgi:hypothetical protein